MKVTLEYPLEDGDLDTIAADLAVATDKVNGSESGRVTIIKIGPCELCLEDGMIKIVCEG